MGCPIRSEVSRVVTEHCHHCLVDLAPKRVHTASMESPFSPFCSGTALLLLANQGLAVSLLEWKPGSQRRRSLLRSLGPGLEAPWTVSTFARQGI
ncbi:hypothetical protein U0070_023655 [Myodes glareolus]|uniref:Uncharacterized protein n=1 Tax=Myodes glareolus TaxID=447135 RepID=A0AAW0IP21_MYOGA